MTIENPERANTCPHCHAAVDPLRAGAVSIVSGRITHFCSAACREAFLKRSDAAKTTESTSVADDEEESLDAVSVSQTEDLSVLSEEKGDEPSASVSETSSRGARRMNDVLRLLLWPLLTEAVVLLLLAGLAFLIPRSLFGGWIVSGAALAGCLISLGFGVFRERQKGVLRILEAATVPGAALLIAVAPLASGHSRLFAIAALALLLAEKLGRIVEILFRHRTGITGVIVGHSPPFLASEWRDNSSLAEKLRRFAIALEWARLPIAVGVGVLVWFGGEKNSVHSMLAVATSILALNPRGFRMATGDAHLAAALRAADKGAVIRDANALDRLGICRFALFMSRYVLLRDGVRVIDWRTVPDADEQRVMSAVWAVESAMTDRFAAAITEYLSSRNSDKPAAVTAERVPGQGVKGSTDHGFLMCGTRTLFLDQSISTGEFEEWARGMEGSGRRAFFVSLDGAIVAMFGVEELPREGVQDAMQRLSMMGVEPAMITSAEVDAAHALGTRLGIEHVKFEKGESDLESVIGDIEASGTRMVLAGRGQTFEESLCLATAAIAMDSHKSLAGLDARTCGIREVVQLIHDARWARRSVTGNVAFAALSAVVGVCLAIGWQAPQIALFVGAMAIVAGAVATLNGPYPTLLRGVRRLEKWFYRLMARLGMGRT